jgi:sucrose-6-phosphate hydrolase SacC (GH32 family)
VPWELSLYKTPDGYRLRCLPVAEIESLRGKKHSFRDQWLIPGQNPAKEINHDLLDIDATILTGPSGTFGFNLLGMEIGYDIGNKKMSAFGKSADLVPVDGKLEFRILLDRTSIEIFANDGTCVMTGLFMPQHDKPVIELTATKDAARIIQLDIYEMESIWEQKQ